MKKYTLEYRSAWGEYCALSFTADNDAAAQTFAREFMREHWTNSCPWIYDTDGRYFSI